MFSERAVINNARFSPFPVRPVFSDEEIANFSLLSKQEYAANPVLRGYRNLPRISVSVGPPEETPESTRRLVDTSDANKWRISKSREVITARGVERYEILEKIGSGKNGRIVITLNVPFFAFLDTLDDTELNGQTVVIANPGITQEVVDGNNRIIRENNLNLPLITKPDEALMSVKNKKLLEERKARPVFWDTAPNQTGDVEDFRDFLGRKSVKGIILNGGGMPTTADWLVRHLQTIHDYLEGNPQAWCALLCAPVYIINSGHLYPTYEADIYAIPKNSIKMGTGYVGEGIAFNIHSDSRNRLGKLKKFYHSKNKIVVDVPEKGIFVY